MFELNPDGYPRIMPSFIKNAMARVQLVVDGKLFEYTMDVSELHIHDSDYYEFEVKLLGIRTDPTKWEMPDVQ